MPPSLQTAEGRRILRWDATNGISKGDFAVAPIGNGDLQWCGPDHLLVGETLIDLNLKWPLVTYAGLGSRAAMGPDGRLWFASGNGQSPSLLAGYVLPDEATRQFAKLVAAGQVQAALMTGMTINVRLDGASPDTDADAFRRTIIDRQQQSLKSRGFKTGSDGALTLAIQIQPARDTGQIVKYDLTAKNGAQSKADLHVLEVNVQLTLSDNRGVLWSQKEAIQTVAARNINEIDQNEGLQAKMNREMWGRVALQAGVSRSANTPYAYSQGR